MPDEKGLQHPLDDNGTEEEVYPPPAAVKDQVPVEQAACSENEEPPEGCVLIRGEKTGKERQEEQRKNQAVGQGQTERLDGLPPAPLDGPEGCEKQNGRLDDGRGQTGRTSLNKGGKKKQGGQKVPAGPGAVRFRHSVKKEGATFR
jgi:hypothetical protein